MFIFHPFGTIKSENLKLGGHLFPLYMWNKDNHAYFLKTNPFPNNLVALRMRDIINSGVHWFKMQGFII